MKNITTQLITKRLQKITKNLFLIVLITIFFNQAKADYLKKDASRSDTIDVIHYNINLEIMNFGNKQIKGFTEIKIASRLDNVSKINLDLLAMTIDSIIVDNSKLINYKYNNKILEIPLNTSLNTGDISNITIYYKGSPQSDPSTQKLGGFQFDANYAYNIGVGLQAIPHNLGKVWFPCNDNFTDKATYDFIITTAKEHKAVCNGLLIEEKEDTDSTKIYHWQMTDTIPTYLASVAVSKYGLVKDTVNALTGNIPIHIYANVSDTGKVRKTFTNLKKILKHYEYRFGPYRWQRIGYVGVPFAYGAMEHATNIAYPNIIINGSSTYENIYAHELAHHWFGDLITCSDAYNMWINEGWALYCEFLYRESLYSNANFKSKLRSNQKYVIQFLHKEDKEYRALVPMPQEYTYSSTVYKKGAAVVNCMKHYIGEDLFYNTIKQLLNDYKFKNISSEELRDYLTAKTGINMNSFFDTYVFDKGFPHFSVDSFKVIESSANNYKVKVNFRQRLRGTDNYAKNNRIEITFMNKKWESFTDSIIFSGALATKVFNVPFNPDFVLVDKEEKTLDATVDSYMTIKNTGTYDLSTSNIVLEVSAIKDSVFFSAQHNYVTPDQTSSSSNLYKRISKYRYWKIDGIFNKDFVLKTKFFYSKGTDYTNGHLDNDLLLTSKSIDSLFLLYRKNTAENWSLFRSTLKGNATQGYLISDSIKPGEYCLAIGHTKMSVNTLENPVNMDIYPNPSQNFVYIENNSKQNLNIKVYDLSGKQIDKFQISKNTELYKWQSSTKISSILIFDIFNSENKKIGAKKITYNNIK